MKDEIKSKLDEHVKQLLAKPYITNEDYALLRERLSELPDKNNSGWEMMWVPLMLMLCASFGGTKG